MTDNNDFMKKSAELIEKHETAIRRILREKKNDPAYRDLIGEHRKLNKECETWKDSLSIPEPDGSVGSSSSGEIFKKCMRIGEIEYRMRAMYEGGN